MKNMPRILLIACILIVVVGGGAYALTSMDSGKATMDGVLYTVERGPLQINLTETGTIKSRDQHIVKSEVEGRTSVIYVIDEGTVVKKGDLLIELDSSALQDRLVDQQIQVENTEANYVTSEETVEVTRIQNRSNIARAEQDYQFAIEDKQKYIEGEWPKLLMKAQADVTLAEEDFRRATDEFEWSKRLFDEKYLSESEYRADELSKKRAELQVELAREDLKLLTEYTHIRRLTELDSEIEQRKLALDRVNRESSSNLVQAEARQRANGAELNRQKGRLAKIEDQISKSKMYAPADGMVVYASSTEFSWRGDSQPLDEGQEVRERQELIHLPTADSMMVEIQVQESALGKVKLGQRAVITVDAFPGRTFTGEVTKIAPLPDATSVFMNPDLKVYDTQVMIDGVFPELRTGMSCKATIQIEEYNDALSVPIQSVVGHGGESVVYLAEGNSSVRRSIETGLDNNAMVHVISGIDPGDKILLTPPLSGDASPKQEAVKSEAETTSTQQTSPASGRRPSGTGQRPPRQAQSSQGNGP